MVHQTASQNNNNNSNSNNNSSSDDNNSTVTGTVPYKEGIYYGTAEGYSGDVSVAVVIQEKTIKAILITESSDDEAFFNRAMDVVKKVIQDTEDRRCRYSVRSNLQFQRTVKCNQECTETGRESDKWRIH